MKLTKDQVKKVAKLANLPLTDKEEEKYTAQLSEILDYVDQLNQANTTNIESTFNVTGNENILREDQTAPSLPQAEALANAPKAVNGFFATKGIFENE